MPVNIKNLEGVERQELRTFAEQAYLDFSMYVILDRALPRLGDGCKPVQRRIVHAMAELGLTHGAKFKKSARTIGDVLGKFHPHGEVACYEAMVLMAQSFSYRYPLIEGQGNWGSPDDPKSFAAMRYTEARLTRYADLLLSELGQGTVEWGMNFDGTLKEPKTLPARLPNILLNGTTGIAVGMATDVPPHNLVEVGKACIHLLNHPQATVAELCRFIPGPDYPTEAEIITPRSELLKIYQTGNGSLRMRAVYQLEDGDIVITALPYMVSGAKVLEQIAALMQAKKLPQVADLRDESDHENPTRLVIVPRSNRVEVEQIMNYLFAQTELERPYRVNLNVIGLDGSPKNKNLLVLLQEWLAYRIETVRRRIQFRLEKILTRLHLLEGFLIAFLHIDDIIHLIRTKDEPKPLLMKKYGLTETQAEAILELKLRHLAKLEEVKLRGEQKELDKERVQLEKALSSDKHLRALIQTEIEQDIRDYGDKRRSPLVEREQVVVSLEQHIPSEPITVILSNKGWVRAAKGHDVAPESLSYKTGDGFMAAMAGKTDQPVVFIDSTGRAYTLYGHSLPSARGQGEPLTERFKTPPQASWAGFVMAAPESLILLVSDLGYGFKVPFAELIGKNRSGKAIIKVKPEGGLAKPVILSGDKRQRIALFTADRRLLVISVTDIAEMTKGKGQKLIQIPKAAWLAREGQLVDVIALTGSQALCLKSARKQLVLTGEELKPYLGEAGQRGHKLPKGYDKWMLIDL